MSSDLEFEGFDKILSRVEEMGKAGNKIANEGLKASGQVILDESKSILEMNGSIRTGRLKEGLKLSRLKRKGNKKYINVGIQKGDTSKIFYGKFVEWGTSKMSAKPFLGPAFESKKDEAKEILISEIKRGLKL